MCAIGNDKTPAIGMATGATLGSTLLTGGGPGARMTNLAGRGTLLTAGGGTSAAPTRPDRGAPGRSPLVADY